MEHLYSKSDYDIEINF